MSDNTTLPSTDTIRDIDRAGVKTQVFVLDQGGTGAESLVTTNNPLSIETLGSDDLLGVNILESCVRGDLALHVNPINQPTRDINGNLILSDAPNLINLVGSVVGQSLVIDTQGYQSLHITSATLAATVASSDDGVTWQTLTGLYRAISTPTVNVTSATGTMWPCLGRYIKLTVTTVGTAKAYLRNVPVPMLYNSATGINVVQVAGTATANGGISLNSIATTNGQSIPTINVVTATAPAAVVVKASAGRLTMLNITNGAANAAYLHLYNAASVTMGTTASTMVFAVPAVAGTNIPINLPEGGLYFSTGICYAFTGAIASTDNTALTAPSLVANLAYI